MMAELNIEKICFVAYVPFNTLVYDIQKGPCHKVETCVKSFKYQSIMLRQVASDMLKAEAAMRKVWIKTRHPTRE